MDKSEVKYKNIKDKLKFKVNSKVEDPILVLKAKIEKIKSAVTKT